MIVDVALDLVKQRDAAGPANRSAMIPLRNPEPNCPWSIFRRFVSGRRCRQCPDKHQTRQPAIDAICVFPEGRSNIIRDGTTRHSTALAIEARGPSEARRAALGWMRGQQAMNDFDLAWQTIALRTGDTATHFLS
jgi:hypothetical protein